MIQRQRVLALGILWLAVNNPIPALAQTPCGNADKIGCTFHPDYGWIAGSAPAMRYEQPAPRRPDEQFKPAPPEPAYVPKPRRGGTCEFPGGGAGFISKGLRMSDQQLIDSLARNEDECSKGFTGSCWEAAQDNTYLRSPPANPTKAYQLIQQACVLEGGQPNAYSCEQLRKCLPGAPEALASPSQ